MKIFIVFFVVFFISPVYAKMYKCLVGEQVSYQDTECEQGGGEFKKKKDISVEQQQEAAARLNADLTALAENRRLAQEYEDKERLIQAEEDNAYANYQTARQAKRQADALEDRNYIEQERLDNRNVYITPYYPRRFSIPRPRPTPYPHPRPILVPHPSKFKVKVY